MAKNSWLGKKVHLVTANGLSLALLVRGRKDKNGTEVFKKGDNELRLVAGSRSGRHVNFYKMKAVKNGRISRYWKECILVPRGTDPVALVDDSGAPLAPLGPNPTPQAVQVLAGSLIQAINKAQRATALRLECDVVVPAPGTNDMTFGVLRLFQVPKAYGSKTLLVMDLANEGGLPGGNGGGGSVHT